MDCSLPGARHREPDRRRQPHRRRAPAGARPMSQALETPVAVEAANSLELRDLDVVYRVRGRDREVLRGVTLSVGRGEAYGLVGESGCGKSTSALAIVQYLPRNGRVRNGQIQIDDRDVLSLSRGQRHRLRD